MNDLWIAFLMMLSEMTAMEMFGSIMIAVCVVLLYCVGLFSEVS
ncbi:hypothetical protein [Macrococcoides goetzii]|nr:hypothetical protein [Macrococcus goetzii]